MLIDSANIFREKRKTIKIIITESGQLNVYCPKTLSTSKINEILTSKQKLLEKKLNNIQKTNNKFKEIINYNQVLLLGKQYLIVPTQKVGKSYFTENTLLIPNKYYNTDKIPFYTKKVMKDIATKIITNRVEALSKIDKKFKYTKISIGSFKSKWGSCDSLGSLKFNWKLVMLNPQAIDFVIFHELTHLIELNHSNKFYENLELVCPNWKLHRKTLKKHSFLLNLYN